MKSPTSIKITPVTDLRHSVSPKKSDVINNVDTVTHVEVAADAMPMLLPGLIMNMKVTPEMQLSADCPTVHPKPCNDHWRGVPQCIAYIRQHAPIIACVMPVMASN